MDLIYTVIPAVVGSICGLIFMIIMIIHCCLRLRNEEEQPLTDSPRPNELPFYQPRVHPYNNSSGIINQTVPGSTPVSSPQIGVCGAFPAQVGVYGALQPQTGVYEALQPQTGVYGAFQPQTGVYGALQPQTGVYGALQPQTGVYGVLPSQIGIVGAPSANTRGLTSATTHHTHMVPNSHATAFKRL